MKWFKHISDSLDDPFIDLLFRKFRHKGYVCFFGMIEIVSRECTNFDTLLKLNYHFCGTKVRLSVHSLRTILTFISTTGRFEYYDKGEYFLIRIPKLVELRDNYTKDKLARHPQESCPPLQSKIKSIDKEEERHTHRGGVFSVPSLADVKNYREEINYGVDPQEFVDFYASKGWKVGSSPMKDWKAAYRNSKTWRSANTSASSDKSHDVHNKIMETAIKIKLLQEANNGNI